MICNQCPETPLGKPDIGLLPCLEINGSPVSPLAHYGVMDSPKSEKEDSSTGNSWSPSPRKSLLRRLEAASPLEDTMNQPGLRRRKTIVTKKKVEMENLSNLVLDPDEAVKPSKETVKKTGMKSRRQLSKDDWKMSPATSTFVIIARYAGKDNSDRIAGDNLSPQPYERHVRVFWGPTGTGKSRRAWEEALALDGPKVYVKDPRTKFWCGYRGQESVILDEFRGGIDIAHMLRWLDRYPVCVETKGSAEPLVATRWWITSNIHPRDWYPDCDEPTRLALERRLEVINML